ncbi:NUDIX domain-containing protein [Oceanirhabdus sp. W0125-5]|uniref:NUDIX domain-containing protein n=1 Tax=Oceanirhabdus sp. W0125-5 TaxID=2999116 RepID=UPI0022F31B31|nr:NUDIX domain-containing protein [Oceanirhabdus sp. W0125-5]WBW97517.1 NUDIX domain-containing protein [Oceanirhabdus sp. W0125-5]
MELNDKIQLCIIQNGKIALIDKKEQGIFLPNGFMRKGETRIKAAWRISLIYTGIKVRVLPIWYVRKNNNHRVITVLAYPIGGGSNLNKYRITWKNINCIESLSDVLKRDIYRIKQCINNSELIDRAGLLVYKKQKNKIKFLFISSLINANRFIIPQGHVEQGETYEYAAIRETKEEAGVEADIREKLGFFFLERGKNIYQTHIYLAKFTGYVESTEDRIVKWLSFDEIMKKDIPKETKIFVKDLYCNKKKRKLLK